MFESASQFSRIILKARDHESEGERWEELKYKSFQNLCMTLNKIWSAMHIREEIVRSRHLRSNQDPSLEVGKYAED